MPSAKLNFALRQFSNAFPASVNHGSLIVRKMIAVCYPPETGRDVSHSGLRSISDYRPDLSPAASEKWPQSTQNT